MIKSSDKEFNNIYRILRVLDNQDYLAIDSFHNQYIFSQYEESESMISCQSFLKEKQLQEQESAIKMRKQCITINNIKYYVFDAGKSQLIWVKNMNPQHIKQPNFVFNLVKDAIFNILDKLLWLETKMISVMLNIKNFWIIDGSLCFILMPRITKSRLSILKQQKKCSISSNENIITSLIQNQNKFIKKFARIIQQIVSDVFTSQQQSQSTQFIKQLLTKMSNKTISFQELKQQLHTKQTLFVRSNIYRFQLINKKMINKKRNSISRYSSYTQPTETILSKIKEKSLFKVSSTNQKNNNSLIYNVGKNTKLLQIKSQQKQKKFNSIQKRQQSEIQYSSITKRYSSFGTIQNGNGKKINQKERVRYLNWIREAKDKRKLASPIKQQVQYQSTIARRKFLERGEKKQQKIAALDDKLQEKLLTKMAHLKFRQYQKRQQLRQRKIESSGKKDKIEYRRLDMIQKCKTMGIQSHQLNYNEQLQEIKLSVIAQLKNGTIEVGRMKLRNKQRQGSDIFQKEQIKEDTFPFQEKDNQFQEKITFANKKQLQIDVNSENKDKTKLIMIDQKADQYQYQIKKKLYKVQQKQINQRKAQQRTNEFKPYKKQNQFTKNQIKKVKNSGLLIDQTEFQKIEDDLQIITLSNPPKQTPSEYYKQNEARQQSNKTIAKNKSIESKSKPFSDKEQQKIEKVNELIDEYLSILNILGDISVKIVHNKQSLKSIQWRKPIYFIYQRFYFQRTQFLKRLKANNFRQIIRKNRQMISQSWNTWIESKDKHQLINQVQAQNLQIQKTFHRFSNKICAQCNLQSNLLNLIKNRQIFLSAKVKNHRFILSKFAVALVVNEYDKILESKLRDKYIINFILDCIFGLRIIAELDGFVTSRQIVTLQQYKLHKMTTKQAESIIQEIYNLYYPQTEAN